MSDSWTAAALDLAVVLELVRPGQFAIVECAVDLDPDDFPYVQAARSADGWYCEVVSRTYLPATAWPIDEVALRRLGWSPPGDGDNWHREAALADDVASLLLTGLRQGRACPDDASLNWWVGTFPPGPDNGERTDNRASDMVGIAA